MQICFDPAYPMPTVGQVDLALGAKYPLDSANRTTIAPAEKFMVVTFTSSADAATAEIEAPRILKIHLQKHSKYKLSATLMAVHKGRRLIKDAAERRQRPGKARPAVGGTGQRALGAEPGPGSLVQQQQQQALPAWPQAQAHAPMYVQPAMGPMAMPHGSFVAQAPAQAQAPQQPLPAGFLHTFTAPTQQQPAVAGPVAELGPASDARQGGAAAVQGMPDLGNLEAILQTATAGDGGADGPAPAEAKRAPEADASSMLGLLQQLGSTQQQ